MKRHLALGDFVAAYLRKIGVRHVFGIPGDLALKLFFRLGKRHGLEILTLSHEPGVGFAADGYARATGRIGVICVTYGAGGHNMVNPVAGSFSERVPILIFSGGPGEEERKLGTLIHHQAREIDSQLRIYREVTCASHVLTDPRRASLYAVTIPTEMAYEETADLLGACERMKVCAPVIFINLATPQGGCPLCSALRQREFRVEARFRAAFPGTRQAQVSRCGEPRGRERLHDLGRRLYAPA